MSLVVFCDSAPLVRTVRCRTVANTLSIGLPTRSVRYQMSAARFPVAKTLVEFDFAAAAVNEALVRSLHAGDFLDQTRNAVLVGGTGSGKTHLAIAIGTTAVQNGRRVRFYNAVDLVNRLDGEMRDGRTGRLTEQLCRVDLVIIDELGYPMMSSLM